MKNKEFPNYFRACGQRIDLHSRVLIMGILNVTPDSFSDGGRYLDPSEAVDRALSMIEEGADIIDIGGESTRPGALLVDEQEEMRRLRPVLQTLGSRCTVPISIDTRKASVAKMALDLGATIVNDVSALRHDPQMTKVVAESSAGLVLMHMRGTPETMQDSPVYENVVDEVKEFFARRLEVAAEEGISMDSIVLDPGIGFGKTVAHNLILISQCGQLQELGRPILIGVSNKSFIGKIIDKPMKARVMGNTSAVAIAIFQGAKIIRVHDVRAMNDVRNMAIALRDSTNISSTTLTGSQS